MTNIIQPSPKDTAPSAAADLERVTALVQKLLAKGRKAGTEAESAAFMAKAQELLTAHNLSMSAVEGAAVGDAKREKAAQTGGQYVYQQQLWWAVAELNFCLHFISGAYVKVGSRDVWRRQHKIVGRVVNVQATMAMGTYLEAAANRLCRERLTVRSGAGVTPGELNSQFYSSWAVGFREGVADRLIEKLEAKRARRLNEERLAAKRAAAAGTSTSTALTLGSLVQKEEDENWDFLRGDELGTRAQERAERALAAAQAEAEYTAWAQANPEEAARRAKAAREEREKRQARYRGGGAGRQVNWSGYSAGQEAGAKVGIDPQTRADKVGGLLR
jgi:hypothetical protein